MDFQRPVPELVEGKTAELTDLFRPMDESNRLWIVLACLGGPVCVGDIAKKLSLSGSLVSHHLRLLRAARALRGIRNGKARLLYSER